MRASPISSVARFFAGPQLNVPVCNDAAMGLLDSEKQRLKKIEARLDELFELLKGGPPGENIARLGRLRFRILSGGLETTLIAGRLRTKRPGVPRVVAGVNMTEREVWDDGTWLSTVGRFLAPGEYSWDELADACAVVNRRALRHGRGLIFEPGDLVDVVHVIANAMIPAWAGDVQPGVPGEGAAGGAGGAAPKKRGRAAARCGPAGITWPPPFFHRLPCAGGAVSPRGGGDGSPPAPPRPARADPGVLRDSSPFFKP